MVKLSTIWASLKPGDTWLECFEGVNLKTPFVKISETHYVQISARYGEEWATHRYTIDDNALVYDYICDAILFQNQLETFENHLVPIQKQCQCDIWSGGCSCGAIQPYKTKW